MPKDCNRIFGWSCRSAYKSTTQLIIPDAVKNIPFSLMKETNGAKSLKKILFSIKKKKFFYNNSPEPNKLMNKKLSNYTNAFFY